MTSGSNADDDVAAIAAGVAAARSGVAAFDLARDALSVAGPDAVSYLQGQVSADVAALDPGASTWALLLEPQGKVSAWCRVTRTGEEDLLLDVDGGWGDAVLARLRRFLMRVDVTIESAPHRWVALRGPGAAAAVATLRTVDAPGEVLDVDWRGLAGVDLALSEGSTGPDVVDGDWFAPEGLDVLRVEQGWPAMGRELDGSTIPAEAGEWLIDASVSFTKGCYTGQELVARVHSRGASTPRRLRGLVLDGGTPPAPGTPVLSDGVERATVTSAAASPTVGAPIALAMLHRSVDAGATVDVGGTAATVVELPFAAAP